MENDYKQLPITLKYFILHGTNKHNHPHDKTNISSLLPFKITNDFNQTLDSIITTSSS